MHHHRLLRYRLKRLLETALLATLVVVACQTAWGMYRATTFRASSDPLTILHALAPDLAQRPLSDPHHSPSSDAALILASPFTDSVRAVFGASSFLIRPSKTTSGQWLLSSDIILLTPEAHDALFMRHTIVHELAHHASSIVGALAPNLFAPTSVPPRTPRTVYASCNPAEHGAEAAALAFDFLSIATRPIPPSTLDSALTALDSAVPGTRLWVRVLLTHPLFARHPLATGRLRLPHLTPLDPPWRWAALQHPAPAPRRLFNTITLDPGLASTLLTPLARIVD